MLWRSPGPTCLKVLKEAEKPFLAAIQGRIKDSGKSLLICSCDLSTQNYLSQVPTNLKKAQMQEFSGGILDQSLGLSTSKFRFLFPLKERKK